MKALSIIVGIIATVLAFSFYSAGVGQDDPTIVYHYMFWSFAGGGMIFMGIIAD